MKNIKIQLLFLLTVIFFSFQVNAQPPYPEWRQFIPVHGVWNTKLVDNTLYVSTGHFGYGVIAYDLNTIETEVFSEYSAGLASDNITAIDVDAEGNVWLGHHGYGISKLSGNSCTIYNSSNSNLINDTIRTICVDISGKIWIGTWRGVCSFDGQNWQTYTSNNSDLPNDTISVIITDSDNKKWMGLKGGFAIFDDITWEIHMMFQPPMYVPIIENMIVDENGNAWLDIRHYGSSLFKYDGDTIVSMNWPPIPYNYISDFELDNEGNLWMSIFSGMDEFGLAMYNGNSFTTIEFPDIADYIDNASQSLEIDGDGNKWIGSLDNGLLKYNDVTIEQISDGIFGLRFIRDLAIENNNRIWLTNNDGLTEFNSGEWNFYSYYNSEFPSESSRSLAIDKSNKKWIGGENQLITFDDENWFVYDTSNSPITYGNPQSIDNIVIDKNDTKWFSKNGLYKYDNESWYNYSTENSAIPSDNIFCLAADSSDVVWLGHYSMGVSSFNGIEWDHYDTTNSVPQISSVRSIYIDSLNTKWFCTHEGLLSFDGSNWIIFDTSNTELPSNKVYTMLFDNYGKMWVGTKKGIGVYDGTWMIYDSTNSSLKRNRVIKLSQSDNNDIWIIHQDGLSVYNENGFMDIEEHPINLSPSTKITGFPNPFSSETAIQFNLQKPFYGELSIYNLTGQKIKSIYKGEFSIGENVFKWDGKNADGYSVENGIYFCRLFTNKPVGTCKLILSRN